MVTVQKANVVLQITESEVEKYLDLGYSVIDDKGNVIKTGMPTDIPTLQSLYVTHMAEIKKLEEENAKLRDEIKDLKKKPTTKPKAKEKPLAE